MRNLILQKGVDLHVGGNKCVGVILEEKKNRHFFQFGVYFGCVNDWAWTHDSSSMFLPHFDHVWNYVVNVVAD